MSKASQVIFPATSKSQIVEILSFLQFKASRVKDIRLVLTDLDRISEWTLSRGRLRVGFMSIFLVSSTLNIVSPDFLQSLSSSKSQPILGKASSAAVSIELNTASKSNEAEDVAPPTDVLGRFIARSSASEAGPCNGEDVVVT